MHLDFDKVDASQVMVFYLDVHIKFPRRAAESFIHYLLNRQSLRLIA